MARKAMPRHLKIVRGTLKAHPELADQPEAEGELGEPGEYLGELERQVWRDVMALLPAGLLRALDRGTFESYVVLRAAWLTVTQAWIKGGRRAVVTVKGRKVGNPYLAELHKLSEHLRKLEGEFGFTPSARTRISLGAKHAGVSADPLAKFLKKHA